MIRALLLVTFIGCSHPATPPVTAGSGSDATVAATGPAVITDEADAAPNVGKRTGVKGTAGNAKLGGVIMTASHFIVYCGGVTEWPGDVNGKPVTAFGTLTQSAKFEAHGSGGEISQGTNGPVWLLENCQYE
ncbi:MAG: hypothetical protein ABI678_00225 [Kofleriaceae bacterium]